MMLCQHMLLLLLLVLAMLLPLSESPSSAEPVSFNCRLSRNCQYSCGPSSACKQKTQVSFGSGIVQLCQSQHSLPIQEQSTHQELCSFQKVWRALPPRPQADRCSSCVASFHC